MSHFIQGLRAWALAHQHGEVDHGLRYSRPSVHFWVEEGRLTLLHTPGRSLAQVGLQEIYGILQLAKMEGRDISVPQSELLSELMEIDSARAHAAATAETGFLLSHTQSHYGRNYGRLIRDWIRCKAHNDAAHWDFLASHGEATPRWCGYMIMSESRKAELAKPAKAYVEAVKRHLLFPE